MAKIIRMDFDSQSYAFVRTSGRSAWVDNTNKVVEDDLQTKLTDAAKHVGYSFEDFQKKNETPISREVLQKYLEQPEDVLAPLSESSKDSGDIEKDLAGASLPPGMKKDKKGRVAMKLDI